ncbi:hypothetical protein M5K25_006777 [Dendrobium thyrsiflorum]|uniref:RNase H type-1 domain-containing protein n=1 Tax=Dendrobium thyrsiflorum TaxID=117978 RepID=A0ABD0VJG9_DENTH
MQQLKDNSPWTNRPQLAGDLNWLSLLNKVIVQHIPRRYNEAAKFCAQRAIEFKSLLEDWDTNQPLRLFKPFLWNSPSEVVPCLICRDVFTWSSMVDGYWKNGMVLEARQAFEAMPVKNVVSWTAMIQDMSGVPGGSAPWRGSTCGGQGAAPPAGFDLRGSRGSAPGVRLAGSRGSAPAGVSGGSAPGTKFWELSMRLTPHSELRNCASEARLRLHEA